MYVITVKSTVEISQNFVAFYEYVGMYMNFTKTFLHLITYFSGLPGYGNAYSLIKNLYMGSFETSLRDCFE